MSKKIFAVAASFLALAACSQNSASVSAPADEMEVSSEASVASEDAAGAAASVGTEVEAGGVGNGAVGDTPVGN